MDSEERGAWIGKQIGSYRLEERIGRGGMGEVYRARDTHLPRYVAIKVLRGAFSTDPARQARLRREAGMLAALNHPNIATIHGVEYGDGLPAIVMELVEGATLADRIANGPVPLPEALPVVKQIADGLAAAHQRGIIHRDLKPANIKIRPDGTVKVLDFGLAKLVGGAQAGILSENDSSAPTTPLSPPTAEGAILGTPAYMSPEHASGRDVDQRTDIWAFGCVVYELLAGVAAFRGDTVSETLGRVFATEPDWEVLPGDTPPHLRELLARCLAKDPGERLGTIHEVRTALSEVLPPGRFTRHLGIHYPHGGAGLRRAAVWLVVCMAGLGVMGLITNDVSTRRAAAASASQAEAHRRSRDELIAVLEGRAKIILRDISQERERMLRDGTPSKAALQDARDLEQIGQLFAELHGKHIDALRQDQLVAAAELQREIYHLLYIRAKFVFGCITCAAKPLAPDRGPVLDTMTVDAAVRLNSLIRMPSYTTTSENSDRTLDPSLIARLVTQVRANK